MHCSACWLLPCRRCSSGSARRKSICSLGSSTAQVSPRICRMPWSLAQLRAAVTTKSRVSLRPCRKVRMVVTYKNVHLFVCCLCNICHVCHAHQGLMAKWYRYYYSIGGNVIFIYGQGTMRVECAQEYLVLDLLCALRMTLTSLSRVLADGTVASPE